MHWTLYLRIGIGQGESEIHGTIFISDTIFDRRFADNSHSVPKNVDILTIIDSHRSIATTTTIV